MPVEIPDLVKQFSKQTGCKRYTHDSEKLALLTDYIWLWQLTPTLPFETFLEKYQAVADHDETNLKHPDAAMRMLCPRTQASSTRLNRPQWTAAQLADFMMLYVDMIRAADEEHIPVPLPFSTFLKNLGPKYLDGTFPPPDPAATPATPAATTQATTQATNPVVAPVAAQAPPPPTPVAVATTPATTSPARPRTRRPAAAVAAGTPVAPPAAPTLLGQRVIYKNSGGRERVGAVESIDADAVTGRSYAVFVEDTGERFEGIAVESIRPATAADAPLPTPPVGPRVASARITIPRASYPSIAAVLGLKQACGTCAVGGVIYSFETPFDPAAAPGLVAHVDVINGETGPYVDSYIQDASGATFADVPPRENIIGTYTFTTPQGIYSVTVASRGAEAETPAGAPAA